jgi:hypothetical protein
MKQLATASCWFLVLSTLKMEAMLLQNISELSTDYMALIARR